MWEFFGPNFRISTIYLLFEYNCIELVEIRLKNILINFSRNFL